MTCNPLKWTDADQRAEDIANAKERAEEKLTDNARAAASALMVMMEYAAAQNWQLHVGPNGTDPDDVIANLADLLGCEVSDRHKRAMREWEQGLHFAHTPEGQA